MIIECHHCESKVDAKELARREYSGGEDGDPSAVFFLECPVCKLTMIGQSDLVQFDHNEYDYERPTRMWPEGQHVEHLDWSIPALVRKSLVEAKKCYDAKA